MKLKIQLFIQAVINITRKSPSLEDKFNDGEFKLETLKLMNQINTLKGQKNTNKPNIMDKYYEKVICSEMIVRTKPRSILEFTLPDLPEENYMNQEKQTGSNI